VKVQSIEPTSFALQVTHDLFAASPSGRESFCIDTTLLHLSLTEKTFVSATKDVDQMSTGADANTFPIDTFEERAELTGGFRTCA
jgi:hypothetical protein